MNPLTTSMQENDKQEEIKRQKREKLKKYEARIASYRPSYKSQQTGALERIIPITPAPATTTAAPPPKPTEIIFRI
jgi:hypothetical protein